MWSIFLSLTFNCAFTTVCGIAMFGCWEGPSCDLPLFELCVTDWLWGHQSRSSSALFLCRRPGMRQVPAPICWRNEWMNGWMGGFQSFTRPECCCLSSQGLPENSRKEGHLWDAVLVTFHLKYVPEMPVWGGVPWNADCTECLSALVRTRGHCCHLVGSILKDRSDTHFSQRNLG